MSIEIVGPFQEHRVYIDGRRVPGLTAHPGESGTDLVIDHRLSLFVPHDADPNLQQIASFVANAIAIGLGYSHHPDKETEPRRRTPFPIGMRLGEGEAALKLVPDRVAQLDEHEPSKLADAGSIPATVATPSPSEGK